MRILTVGNQYPPHSSGGYELVWQSAVRHLQNAGHSVRVLCTDHRERDIPEQDPDVHRQLRWYWREHQIVDPGLRGSLQIERHNLAVLDGHLADFKPDVVSWWSMGALSMSLLERGRRAGLPAVAFVHDDWLDYGRRTDAWHRRFADRRWLARLAERSTKVPTLVEFGTAARYMFVSRHTRARALGSGLGLLETGVAHSGIDEAFIAPVAARRWSWRLLYVGRIDPRKGIDTAVAALALLPPEARLVVAGSGDPEELDRLRARTRELGVERRVEFLGARPHAELPALYADCDAVVFPVQWQEPWGLVPLEAMAFGKPVVATGRGGSAEYLEHGRNCLLFQAGDAAALSAALQRLARDPSLRERLRTEGPGVAAVHVERLFNETVATEVETAARAGTARPRVRAATDRSRGPLISVVVALTLDGSDADRTLASLAAQGLATRQLEVLLVDARQGVPRDREYPNTEREANVRVLSAPSGCWAAACNLGAAEARAPLILFVEAGARAERGLVTAHLDAHTREPDERVGVLGRLRAPGLSDRPESRLRPIPPAPMADEAAYHQFDAGNASLKRSRFDAVGGFDETVTPYPYGQTEFAYRLFEAGFRLRRSHRAAVKLQGGRDRNSLSEHAAAAALAERRLVQMHPELEPRVHPRMAAAAGAVPSRGRAARLARWVPRRTPLIGASLHGRAALAADQQIAPGFLSAWAAFATDS